MVGIVLLRSSRVCAVKEDVAIIIIERKLPPIQRAFLSRLEKRTKHPVSGSWLKNRVDNESS